MKTIKFSFPYTNWPVQRQTPQHSGVWKDYNFIINNDDLKEADYWVVFEDILKDKEKVKCPKENTIFITGEGTATGTYDDRFLRQFNHIITCQKRIKINNTHYFHTANPWFVGKSYDELIQAEEVKKTKNISLICSDKQFTEGHKQRYDFCMQLKQYFGDRLDLFGRGINDFDDKWDTLADYKFSIAIENNVEEDWFTEKLYDCFLSETIPIYYGCPNIDNYFSPESIVKIDINDIEKAIQTIENVLSNENFYQERLKDLQTNKIKYLDNYNIYPLIVNFIENNSLHTKNPKSRTVVLKKRTEQKPMSIKQKMKDLVKKIPIIGDIWHYRNLGLAYEQKNKLENKHLDKNSNDYIQFVRCQPWFANNGDKKLNLTCEGLNEDSVVFDLGGYEGQWASDIFGRYACNVYIFEPYKLYFENIQKRFEKNPKIKVFNIGLSNDEYTSKLYLSNDASSMFNKKSETFVEIEIKKAITFFDKNNITKIDLMKINIEGGEYDLLDHIIATGYINNIHHLKIQFHDFIIENAKERMNKIQEKLSLTHQIVYQYEFVWEHWELKNE
ncbi:MAG: FkbM family methyltransferase [Cytophagales bacterium]|nr:MAG: FkbM family methyltransferase [Cytophagales bacterium]